VSRIHQKFWAVNTESFHSNSKELNSHDCNWLRALVYAEGGLASIYDNFNSIFGNKVIQNEDTLEMILQLADDGKYKNIQTIEFNKIENKITKVNFFETIEGKLIGLEFFSGEKNLGKIGDDELIKIMLQDLTYEQKTELIKDDEQITGFNAFSHKGELFCF
jgi:hypothetical protein